MLGVSLRFVFLVVFMLFPLAALAQDGSPIDPAMVEAFAAWLTSQFGWGASFLAIAGAVIFVANVVDQLWPDERQPPWVKVSLNFFTGFVSLARRWIERWIAERNASRE